MSVDSNEICACSGSNVRYLFHKPNGSVNRVCFACLACATVKKKEFYHLVDGEYEEFRSHRQNFYDKQHEERLAQIIAADANNVLQMSNEDFYSDPRWRRVRWDCLKIFGHVCLSCGRIPPEVMIDVDHIKPRSKYPELAYNVENLQPLCRDCNVGKSNRDETDFRIRFRKPHDP